MKNCEAKYIVLKNFFDNDGYSLNAILISERTDIELKTAYRCISSLVIAGYIRLSFISATEHDMPRVADFYEITDKGTRFMEEEKKFCRSVWRIAVPSKLHWQWRFPYLRFNRS